MRFSTILLALILPFLMKHALAEEEMAEQKSLESEYKRAIELAHNDDHDAALGILEGLLTKNPDNYPVRRDYVVIAGWKGDCDEALDKFEAIQDRPNKEDYLIVPVAECLIQVRRTDEALALLREGSRTYPDNGDIKLVYQSLLNDLVVERKPELSISAGIDQSDAGNTDNLLEFRYSHQLTKQSRWFARYFRASANDTDFDTADLNRLGLGIMYWFHPKWYLEQEFSQDVKTGDDFGSTTTLIFDPTSLWEIYGQYASFAEDIPLRARAVGVTSNRAQLAASYHTLDYRWEWYGTVSAYDFSDSNERRGFYTSLGYGYEMLEKREQRVIVELSESRNTLENTVYFNPIRATDISLKHRTTFVLDSKYDRHVDHLSVYIGSYNQKNYGAHTTYGIGYEQEYDFDAFNSLSWGGEVASRVFDGERETIFNFLVNYTAKFL